MVKITGIGWRLKFYFFLDFVVPINSMIQHTSPSAPHGHLTTAFSRVGYLNLTWVRQGIWTRIVQSFQWNKMSFFFSTRNVGIWTNQSSEVQTPSGVAQWGCPVGLPREGGMMLKLCTDWHILLKGTQRKFS